MSKSIWKFPLEVTNEQVVPMPAGAKVLTVATQEGQPCVWALVDTAAPKPPRKFRIVVTGHTINFNLDQFNFMGTFQLHGGALVFHVFMEVLA